ncbi:hypothetical protein CANINC_001746 [Pichia inconspicua]|uniref:Cytochrome b5 heme-binding domain-containing protein n=1 Tax=Pichia inconspicua TaxID=52247 RepID=A0A4T0X2T4_9ASCO|nr:hypothetical protein CANINC_001746 [[Candida] inconspicua]
MDKLTLPIPGLDDKSKKDKRDISSVSFQVPLKPPHNSSNPYAQMTFPMKGSPQISSSARGRQKVRLKPHHSALDWEQYKQNNNVKNIDPTYFPLRISKIELAKHNQIDDCWMALGGKIYNISKYLDYHPGGAEILLKHAGRDCTSLFMKYHRWVNYERILDQCFIGFLV